MTKFEEEVDKVAKQAGYESLSLLIGDCEEANKIYIHFKNWHSDEEFQEKATKLTLAEEEIEELGDKIGQLESQLQQKDEHILKVENENSFLRDKHTTFDSNGMAVEPKLQQQALPVVPECVGNFLSGKSIFKIANGDIPDDVISWVQEQTYYVDLEKIISHLIILKVTGFTVAVEKPQLFYLKHIDMSKADKEFDHYLFRIEVDRLAHHIVNKNNLPHNYTSVTFTQQEIDSMETGSYEQIEVTE